jgi:hypothetical protein
MARNDSKVKPRKKQQLVIYDPKVAAKIGVNCAVLFERIRYFGDPDNDGWVNKTRTEFTNELGFTDKIFRFSRDRLLELGLIEKKQVKNEVFHRILVEEIPDGLDVKGVTKRPLGGDKRANTGGDKKADRGVQKGTPTHINNIKEELYKKPQFFQTASLLNEFSENLPYELESERSDQNHVVFKQKGNSRLSKKQLIEKLRIDHEAEFNQFWDSYRKAFNEVLKPLGVRNSYGERGSAFDQWCLRRNDGFSAEELIRACRVFFANQVNDARKGNGNFANQKLQNWLKSCDNLKDFLNAEVETQVTVDAKKMSEDKIRQWESKWLSIEEQFTSKPGGTNVLNKTRAALSMRWSEYWNAIYHEHGIQLGIPNYQGEVTPEQYLCPQHLIEAWENRVYSDFPDQADKWHESLQKYQSRALGARTTDRPLLEGTHGR